MNARIDIDGGRTAGPAGRDDDRRTLAHQRDDGAQHPRPPVARPAAPAEGPGPDRLLRPRAPDPDPPDPGHAGPGVQPEVDRASAGHGRSRRQRPDARVPADADAAVRQRAARGRGRGRTRRHVRRPARPQAHRQGGAGRFAEADRRRDLGGALADDAPRRPRAGRDWASRWSMRSRSRSRSTATPPRSRRSS